MSNRLASAAGQALCLLPVEGCDRALSCRKVQPGAALPVLRMVPAEGPSRGQPARHLGGRPGGVCDDDAGASLAFGVQVHVPSAVLWEQECM